MSVTISLKELLEAGCHFGHQAQRWNPKASWYIYTERDGIHIIDLVKTKEGLLNAIEFLKKTILNGGNVLFMGTKRQSKDIIRKEAQRAGVMFISERWPPGLLTNFDVMKKNLSYMKELRERIENKEETVYTKREIGMFEKELNKLEQLYGGIADLKEAPTVLFVTDVRQASGAVKEAKKMGVLIIGIVDTNSDPDPIDYPIPANDDAVGSISIIVKYITDTVSDAMDQRKKILANTEKEDKSLDTNKLSESTNIKKEIREEVLIEKKDSEKLVNSEKTETKTKTKITANKENKKKEKKEISKETKVLIEK